MVAVLDDAEKTPHFFLGEEAYGADWFNPTLTTTAKLPLLGEAVLYWELAGN